MTTENLKQLAFVFGSNFYWGRIGKPFLYVGGIHASSVRKNALFLSFLFEIWIKLYQI